MSVKLTVKFLDEKIRDTSLFLYSAKNIAASIDQYKESHSRVTGKSGSAFYVIANIKDSKDRVTQQLYNQEGKQITEKELKVIKLEHFMQLNN